MDARPLVLIGLTLLACGTTPATGPTDAAATATTDATPDAVPSADVAADAPPALEILQPDPPPTGTPPAPEFQRFCKSGVWTNTLQAATPGQLSGTYKGVLESLGPSQPFKKGTLETMKVVPEHPFLLKQVRAMFAKGTGKVRLRVMDTYGRSYPGPWPKLADLSHDVMPPIEAEVSAPSAETWQTFDLPDDGALLLPTQHYMMVYEHLAQGPALALESLPEGQYSRALLFMPGSVEAYGLSDGKQSFNYRLELAGSYFCAWKPEEHFFERKAPFGNQDSGQVAVIDLDGDGLDDVVLAGSAVVNGLTWTKPLGYKGDGKGGFAPFAADPFGQALGASFALFGDLDNDGDADAVAFPYVNRDGDGDGRQVPGDDCDDTDAKTYKGAKEVAGNGKDDDCDGTVDDGQSSQDADSDGSARNAGDCDDTRADVAKGNPELLDGRDNDCDGQVDEEFFNRALRNDGKAGFSLVANSGVEALDPSTAAALSDANADGKLDVYWGNWLVHYPDDPSVPDRYFVGNGDGTFTDQFKAAGLTLKKPYSCYGVVWCDYDNDGAQDLFVGNYHLYPNQLWDNDGNGQFSDVAPLVGLHQDEILPPPDVKALGLTGGHTYGAEFADYDNDGDMDVFVCNLAHPRTQPWSDQSVLGNNLGAPGWQFQDVRQIMGIAYDEGDINAAWGDYDNDGDLDLVIAGVYTGHATRLYRNDHPNGFVDVTYEAGAALHQASRVVWFDPDRDGDLDLLFAATPEKPHVHMLVNRVGSKQHWVQFDLRGTQSSRDAVGARLYVHAGGKVQMRDVRLGGGHWNVQGPKQLHVGLGLDPAIDKVEVRWLGGKTETFSGVVAGKRWLLVQGSGVAVPKP